MRIKEEGVISLVEMDAKLKLIDEAVLDAQDKADDAHDMWIRIKSIHDKAVAGECNIYVSLYFIALYILTRHRHPFHLSLTVYNSGYVSH